MHKLASDDADIARSLDHTGDAVADRVAIGELCVGQGKVGIDDQLV